MMTSILASIQVKATVTPQVKSRHCYACSPFPGATKNGTSMQRGPDCHSGSQATAVLSASARSPVAKAPTNRPAPPPFSSIMARRRRWLAATKIAARVLASRGLSIEFQDDAIAEAFEAAFEVGDGSGLADLVDIGFAEVAIGHVFGEHVIGGDEDFVSDGERCAQGAAAGLEAVELVLEIAALGSGRGDRGANQDGAEVDVTLAGPAALLPASALVIAGTDARPGRQMIDAKKYAHIDADLGDQHGRNQPVDARNLHQECVLRAIGLEPLANAPVERCDVRLDRFEPAQLHRQEEAVVLLDQRPEHRAAGHAENVGSDARQLDVGGLQQLQEPVAFGRLALHQLAAVAQQLAQLA